MTTNKEKLSEESVPILQSKPLSTGIAPNNNSDYSTITKNQEHSMDYNETTTNFDLWKGLLYMFLSCIFKSIFSILSKYTLKDKKDLSSFQLLSYRTYFMLWITVTLASIMPINIFSEQFITKDKVKHVFFRTIFAILSMSMVIFTIKFMPISDVYSVYYIYPALIILLSYFFLSKEKLGVMDFCCLISCFFGVILVIKPDFIFHENKNNNERAFFFGIVLIAAFLKALEDVLVRNVGKEAHPLIFPFAYSILGMAIFPIPMLIFDKTYPSFSLIEVIVIFLIAICTFLYQLFMALGLQNENAGRVSMVNYAQVALMFVSDLLLFNKNFNIFDLIGTLLIFGCNFVNGFYKAHKRWAVLNKFKNKNTEIAGNA